jgi:hypothetical protein
MLIFIGKKKLWSSQSPNLLLTSTLSPPKQYPPTAQKHYSLSFRVVVVSMGDVQIVLVVV